MKRTTCISIAAICLAVILQTRPVSAETPGVVLDHPRGEVFIVSEELTRVDEKTVVPEGTKIRTGADSSCVLTWNGNIVKMTPLTTMTVSEAQIGAGGEQKSTLDLSSGKVMVHVKKLTGSGAHFQVKTPTAVAGVRGTDLFAAINPDSSATFGVTEGEIFVSVGDVIVSVEENLYVTVGATGEMGTPEPIPENIRQETVQQMKEVKQASTGDPEEAKEEKPAKEEEETAEAKQEAKTAAEAISDEPEVADQTEGVEDAIDVLLDNNKTDEIMQDIERVYKEGSLSIEITVEP